MGEATLLLRRISAGDLAARDHLIALVYGELKNLAARHVGSAHADTLQPTALVHEAWLRLDLDAEKEFENRRHFLGAASRAMRSVLVDHVRARRTRKREESSVTRALDETVAHLERGEADLLDLNEALEELERDDPELGRLVELRFFGGLSHEEIGRVLDCSERTVTSEWAMAKAWLHRELQQE